MTNPHRLVFPSRIAGSAERTTPASCGVWHIGGLVRHVPSTQSLASTQPLRARTCPPSTPAGFIACFFRTSCTPAEGTASNAAATITSPRGSLRNPAPKGVLARGRSGPGLGVWRRATQDTRMGVQERPTKRFPIFRVFQERYESMSGNCFLVTDATRPAAARQWLKLFPTGAQPGYRPVQPLFCVPDIPISLVILVTLVTPPPYPFCTNALRSLSDWAATGNSW